MNFFPNEMLYENDDPNSPISLKSFDDLLPASADQPILDPFENDIDLDSKVKSDSNSSIKKSYKGCRIGIVDRTDHYGKIKNVERIFKIIRERDVEYDSEDEEADKANSNDKIFQ